MNNAKELRAELSEVFMALKNGTGNANDASVMANLTGKMINAARAQIEYYVLRKEKPTIAFLGDDES